MYIRMHFQPPLPLLLYHLEVRVCVLGTPLEANWLSRSYWTTILESTCFTSLGVLLLMHAARHKASNSLDPLLLKLHLAHIILAVTTSTSFSTKGGEHEQAFLSRRMSSNILDFADKTYQNSCIQ